MRTRKVTRYYCDFCTKAGLQAAAMRKHEAHCTMNPARGCRVCGLMGGSVAPNPDGLRAMIAALPVGPGPACGDAIDAYMDAVAAAMPKVRELADNCPACILAALRQSKTPVPMVESFDFKKEMGNIFASMGPQQGYDY